MQEDGRGDERAGEALDVYLRLTIDLRSQRCWSRYNKKKSASCGFFKLPKGLERHQMFFHAVEAGDMVFSGCLSVSQIL